MARIHIASAALGGAFLLLLTSEVARADDAPKAEDRTEVDRHVAESKVHFAFDSAELSAQARATLDEAAEWIKNNKTGTILVEGHADKVGPAPYNKHLAQRRADAARSYLLSRGVKAAQIRILAYGEGLPEDETELPSRLNRRIVLLAVQKEPIVETKIEKRTEVRRVPVPVEKRVFVDRPVEVPVQPPPRRLIGLDLLAGGGVTGFVRDHTNDVTEVGGMWSARVVGGARQFLGFEAAYVGTAQGIDAIGLDSNAVLLGNGVEGNLRLNFLRDRLIQPYIFAGLGWTHYEVSNSDVETAAVEEADDVMHIPAGAGLTVRVARRVALDVRGMFRGAVDDGMFHAPAGDEDDGLESLSGTAQLGFTF
jgi:hypothetical protein